MSDEQNRQTEQQTREREQAQARARAPEQARPDRKRDDGALDMPERDRARHTSEPDENPQANHPRFTLDRLIPTRKTYTAPDDVVGGVTASAMAGAYRKAGEPTNGLTRTEMQAALDDYYAHEPADEPSRKRGGDGEKR